ncbi:hypothetical protein [Qipengyuania flava]|uniref:hypothetical protein n=1 Tax=Qipengyuania flava TaxID=192812 RepID=UPI001C57F63F|nr:hypothetical protein [Qipengyuania flava]MBW3167186.1 hypothetical protein [Qipengyuania flava]MBY5964424.1 hypothetical protein [Qipengyuania flava]MBY6010748.1 hypothetical protein [Qipengyuania flava]MBY6025190.1 hypothetical protein [Qipengyuania flava]
MEALKNLGRPPFANYDIVVYFGGGLFALPFLYRYFLYPFGVPIPSFVLMETGQVSLEIIRGLALLMSVYVLGHLISYLSSQLVEKAIDRFIGKISTAIIVSLKESRESRNEGLKAMVRKRTARIRAENATFSSAVRGFFHIPNVLHYVVVYKTGIFGYLDTRIPPDAFAKAKLRYGTIVLDGCNMQENTKWFKSLEYYVINNIPDAVPRMYNYLVMAGLFRSLSFIFLWSSWLTVVFMITHRLFGTWPLGLTEMGTGEGSGIMEWLSLSSLSVFSLVAYLKFQRRYAEEAIMALAFSNSIEDV